MSEIRTTRGVQPTLGFQEKGEGVAAAEAGLTSPGTANSVEMARMAISSVILGLLRVNYYLILKNHILWKSVV